MLIHKLKYGGLFIILFFACNGFAKQKATDANDLKLSGQIKQLRQQNKNENESQSNEIKMLKEELELLKQNQQETARQSSQQSAPGDVINPYRTYQDFNPDISATGDVLFHSGENDENIEQDQYQFRELELAFGAAVDPYGRADFFIGIEKEDGDWHTHVEEGYFAFDTLPYDLKARVGKFYSAFGKANQFHTHAMPWVDKPALVKNFFGEEGMSEAGAELSWLVPNPWDRYIELIVQVQNNGNEASFAAEKSNDLMYVTHLKNFFEINNDSTVEVGGSFATGTNAAANGGHRTNLAGLDLTCKWRPAQQGLYKSLTSMTELLFSQKEQGTYDTVDSHGLYSSLEYQFSRRWSIFGRYDYSQFPDDSKSNEDAYSVGLTFQQSEYCFWRVQYRHTNEEGSSASDNQRDELFLQLNFGIGPHRAHSY